MPTPEAGCLCIDGRLSPVCPARQHLPARRVYPQRPPAGSWVERALRGDLPARAIGGLDIEQAQSADEADNPEGWWRVVEAGRRIA